MSKGKKIFNSPFIGIDDKGVYPLIFDTKGNFSVFIKMLNPCLQNNSDKDEYYHFLSIFSNMIKTFDAGYSIQKQDIFSTRKWNYSRETDDFLMNKHFKQYEGRLYKYQTTTLILTCELKRSVLFGYDEKKYKEFVYNVGKILSYFNNYDIKATVMTKKEIENYVYRYFSMSFEDDTCSFDNFSVSEFGINIGNKNVQCLSLIDVEMVEMPTFIRPYSYQTVNNRQIPHDLFKFIPDIDADTIIYNQVVFTVNQAGEKARLEAKMKRHQSVPDPANNLCVEDIVSAMDDIERNGQILIYSHFDIIISDNKDLSVAKNRIESFLSNVNIRMSKQAFNQYELFRAAAPGNTFELRNYDRFLTTADVAVSLMYKERIQETEESNLMIWFTDRKGVPIAIDPSDLPMRQNRIDNRNKFVLGPSGSGKSFLMNTMLHQYILSDTDVIMVDVGHSYKGICDYFSGRYVTYSEDKPLSMNPFFINQMEYNIEKVDFLVNLIFLLYKNPHDQIDKGEAEIIQRTIMSYYNNYFSLRGEFTEEFFEQYRKKAIEDWNNEDVHDEDCDTVEKLIAKIDSFIKKQKSYKSVVPEEYQVKQLNFNSFYEYAEYKIPELCIKKELHFKNADGQNNNLIIDYRKFLLLIEKFYKGGNFEYVLNNDIDKTLFDEKFVVFEIDSIQNNKDLFPIITLIIMDVFLQKMRIKKNRKIIVIEEAWKALASPLMADYIKYLYKTVRKFYGEAVTVTQELDDIIKSEIVRDAIISNASTFILCDQTKFKDNFSVVADILSLSEVEQNKIFTINALDNKSNRSKFKEFYIKRGSSGEVYGNEVSIYEYFTYTTEKPEKDAIQTYQKVYKNFQNSLSAFISDLQEAKIEKSDFCAIVNDEICQKFVSKGISNFQIHIQDVCSKFRDSGLNINKFLNLNKKNNENKKNNMVYSDV